MTYVFLIAKKKEVKGGKLTTLGSGSRGQKKVGSKKDMGVALKGKRSTLLPNIEEKGKKNCKKYKLKFRGKWAYTRKWHLNIPYIIIGA